MKSFGFRVLLSSNYLNYLDFLVQNRKNSIDTTLHFDAIVDLIQTQMDM